MYQFLLQQNGTKFNITLLISQETKYCKSHSSVSLSLPFCLKSGNDFVLHYLSSRLYHPNSDKYCSLTHEDVNYCFLRAVAIFTMVFSIRSNTHSILNQKTTVLFTKRKIRIRLVVGREILLLSSVTVDVRLFAC